MCREKTIAYGVFHPEDVERLREEREEALAGGEPFENEQRALGKEGKYRWFLVRYNPPRDDQGPNSSLVCDGDGYQGSQAGSFPLVRS